MTYAEAIAFWYGRINYEVRSASPADLKLGRMQHLLTVLGDPQNAIPTVHISGTKGKGSTAAMIAAIAQAAGQKVGLFTSPHLVHVEERFRINGEPISKAEFAQHMSLLAPAIEAIEDANGTKHTFFEIATALAWRHFRENQVDLAVMEVGLGGRFDSTNVCQPAVTVITSIGYDHMAQLGNTLEEIAYQKAGILKPGVSAVLGPMDESPRNVIRTVANDVNAPVVDVCEPYRGTMNLLGDHQRMNAALAVETARLLEFPATAIETGLKHIDWPARIEVVRRSPTVILDCAHNVPSTQALVKTLRDEYPNARKKTCVFAVSNDKQYGEMLPILAGYFDDFVFTQYGHNPRCVPPETLTSMVPCARVIVPAAKALEVALTEASKQDLIAITGSVFLAGELANIVRSRK